MRALLALYLCVIGSAVAAQGVSPAPQAPASAETRRLPPQAPAVYLVTMGQGDQIWERFGHNFLALEDTAGGETIAYNWGVFDFAAPDFLARFLAGDTRYWMEGAPLARVLAVYPQYNRTITMQRLALTAQQVDTLRRFLEWNVQPENRYYRYDYFRDNCSTRLRDALDLALGGALRRATAPQVTNLTYRNETVRLTDEAPMAQFGIGLALGQPADVLLSTWESMFVPMRMQEYVRNVRVPDASGALVPLVTDERVVFEAQRAPERTRSPSFIAELLAVGALLAGIIVRLGHLALRGRAGAGKAAAAIVAVWGGVTGTVGLVLMLAWVATQHVFWYRNENLFQFNPLAIALVVLVPLALSRPRWWPAARAVAFGVAGLSIAGAALKIFPWMVQHNWGMIVLALPVNVAGAWVVSRLSAPWVRRAGAGR